MNILLQVDPNLFQNATPFSTAIYGLFILGLVSVVIYLAKKLGKKEDEYNQMFEKVIVTITEINTRDSNSDNKAILKELVELKHWLQLKLHKDGE